MNYKHKCNKGFSIIEVIISVAILSILVIPLGNSVMQAILINKKSERIQVASFEGQKILEEFKSYDRLTLEGNEFKLLNGASIYQDSTNKDRYSGEFKYTKGKDEYKVNVLMEKDNNFRSNDKTPAFTISLPKNGELITKEGSSTEIKKEFSNDITNIFVEISSDKEISILYKDTTNNNEIELARSTPIENLDTNKIIINVAENYTRELNIEIKNNMIGKRYNFIANIEAANDEETRGKINIVSTLGDVVIRKNENTDSMERIGDLYNIHVKVSLNNSVLFESSEAQNIEIK